MLMHGSIDNETVTLIFRGGEIIMGIVSWLIIGFLAGWIASMIMKTDAQQGTLMDIILGIVGAFVGGFIMNMLGNTGVTGINFYSIIVATIGAMVVIFIGRKLHI